MGDSADLENASISEGPSRSENDRGAERITGKEQLEHANHDSESRDDLSRKETAIGTIGVYIALASLFLAVVGTVSMYLDFQPYGNLAVTVSLGGITIAMVLGMVYQVLYSNSRSR